EVESMVRSALLLLVLGLPVCAAPAPFRGKSRPLTRAALIGTWEANWGGVRCLITLESNGEYRCKWCGTHYVGAWGLDRDGRVWITESCQPGEAHAWRSYAVRLAPDAFAGQIEVGATGVTVRLERPVRPARQVPVSAVGR